MSDFRHLKVGDIATRMLAGTIIMKLQVSEVTDEFLVCCGPDGWTFRRDNGGEVDDGLGWDGVIRTGSYLVHE
jgi:hypothetical protein